MQKKTSGIQQWIFYLVYLLMGAAVALRMLPHFFNTAYQNIAILLFSAYFVLLLSERWMQRFFNRYFFIYAILQSGIILALFSLPTDSAPQDYFSTLVLPLCGQAIWDLEKRIGEYFVAVFCVFCTIVLLLVYEPLEGIGFALTYVSGCIIVAVLSSATIRSIRAKENSQQLLGELREANQKLVEYSQKVERLTASEERNRLARELHDSVSQTIFSMTLTAQAAKMLMETDSLRAASLLDHLQTLSQNALSEMRTLIQELRPHSIVENGLACALQSHAAERKAQDDLEIALHFNGDLSMDAETAEALFRIVQEALNNVVKHAQTRQASVTVSRVGKQVDLSIEDQGKGFDINAKRDLSRHVGLQSMEERVNSLGGILHIDSQPGKGTRIQISGIPARMIDEKIPAVNNSGEET